MISAFVITADDEPAILHATLSSLRWVDELLLIDKGRVKAPLTGLAPLPNLSVHYAGWSPTVEETRPLALARTGGDWVVCLDADEVLSAECEATFRRFVVADAADVLQVPIRHYLLGRHDRNATSWPEWRPCLFRRGSVEYGPTVHAGTRISGQEAWLEAEAKSSIMHLSNPDVSTYVEKINRYTSRPVRTGVGAPPSGSAREWAVNALLRYESRAGWGADDYGDVAALLRGLYDVVDGLKRWEATQPSGRDVYLEIAEIEADRC